MTALQFGTGWPDRRGRRRTLLWLSDVGWALFDGGHDVQIIRRGLYDEISLRARLLEWPDHVDDPKGAEWVENRLLEWPPSNPNQSCIICQGEGWFAGPDMVAVRCVCGDEP
jgi:hypothetical protein